MAERELDILIAAKDSFSKPLTQAEKAFQNFSDKVEGSSQTMEKSFDSLGGGIMGIQAAWLKVAGVVASAAWLVEASKQALEGEKAMNQLRIQIQSLGLNYASLKGHVEDVIGSTSQYAMVQDDEVASVLQQLIFLTGDYSASVQNLSLVFDLAYQRNISHSEASALVSKAMSGNIEAISKVIPELRILDDALGKNASAATKASAAMDFLSGRVSGAVSEMTEHERKVTEVTLAYNNLKEGIGKVGIEIASLTLKNLNAPFEWLDSVKSAINRGAGLINPYVADPESPESPYPLSTSYKPRFSISKTAKGAGGDDEISIDQFIGASLRMTEEGLKAVPPSLDIPLSLNWTMLSDSVGMESEISTKMTALVEAERLAAQDSLLNFESPYNPKYTGTDQLSGAYQEYDQKLIALEGYNQRKLELMMAAGASELEIEAAHAELSNQYAASRRDFQINSASQTFGAMSNFMQNMYTLTGSKNKAMFQMMKAFAITEAVINTAQAVTAAIKNPPGPPWSFAYAAAAAASGMAQIQTIASSEPGSKQTISATGNASPGYAGGSPTAYPVPTRAEEAKAPISITLVVNTLDGKDVNWDRVIEDNLAPALEKYSKNGNRSLDIKVTKQ